MDRFRCGDAGLPHPNARPVAYGNARPGESQPPGGAPAASACACPGDKSHPIRLPRRHCPRFSGRCAEARAADTPTDVSTDVPTDTPVAMPPRYTRRARTPSPSREAPRRRVHYVHNGAIDTTFARRRCTIHA
ncbi:hypothetical protein BMMON3_13880 [Burkholderia mallei]